MTPSRFLKACRREAVDATPVWFMRQAGRYMPEYRALRAQYSLLEICRTPDLATEVTLQPIRRLEVDAAILFSDLLLPLAPMGLPFDFIKGEGPQIERPIDGPADIERLRVFEPREALGYVLDAIRQIQRELDGRVPLIGFAGAPFTLASYAIEGGHSNNFAKTKALMYGHPDDWHRLCEKLSRVVADYLVAQIDAGRRRRSGLRLVGRRARRHRLPRVRAAPHARHLRGDRHARPDDPFRHRHGDDPRRAARCGRRRDRRRLAHPDRRGVGHESATDHAVQGNLDPTLLLGPPARMMQQTDAMLRRVGGRPGHIFNLGHGILPSTPVEHVQMLAHYVHTASRRLR